MAINFFETMEYLEPKCPRCDAVLDYGVNTRYEQTKKNHVCMNCGETLK